MTKKNQQFSWRQALDEELGDPISLERGEHSGVGGDARHNAAHSEADSTPQLRVNHNLERGDGLQIGYARNDQRNEVNANRLLANDELHIAPTEYPGMFLTADLFDGNNFHHWCRAIKRGLLSRNKLAIIDGSMNEPRKGSIDYMQWLKIDYLVFNWITNSMNKEIARGFQNLETSKQLWDELQKQFGKRNGPRIYKLRREIATYSQENQTVMAYFNNLTALWDDLALIKTSRACTCEALEDAKLELEEEHLMQFLIGLNECYEAIRQQILLLNPLPTISQAYGMVLQVDEQINVTNHLADNLDHSAMYNSKKRGYKRDQFKKD